jgi:hypothetical protein
MNGLAFNLRVTILVRLELPVKDGVGLVDFHIPVTNRSKDDFKNEKTEQEASGGQRQVLQEPFDARSFHTTVPGAQNCRS